MPSASSTANSTKGATPSTTARPAARIAATIAELEATTELKALAAPLQAGLESLQAVTNWIFENGLADYLMAKEPEVVAAEFVRVELTENQVGLRTENGALVEVLPGWAPPSEVVHAVYASRRGQLPAVRALLATDHQVQLSVSFTTRSPRTGEVNGKDYNFVTREAFEGMTSELADRTIAWCENLLGKTQTSWSDVCRVLLVGGA